MLHFAPETFMEKIFSSRVKEYFKVDLNMKYVDSRVDMRCLPFATASFDLVYASHVLEHIKQDIQAINEIKRILVPGGIAILPVPIVGTSTIEYSEPNPYESNHVRAPGKNYFERYKQCFSRVDVFSSSSFDDKYQLNIYEDRSGYPSEKFQDRVAMEGERHSDYVPVCYA
jgi:ubiquinone/menaquinone biosynthesis C-methylase UbiE